MLRKILPSGKGPRRALAGIAVLVCTTWVLTPAGIIELGKKGQKAKGSFTQITVETTPFIKVHDPNEPVEDILEALRVLIDASPSYQATTYNDLSDPTRNAIEVLLEGSGAHPRRFSIFENDENIVGAGVEAPQSSLTRQFTFLGVDRVNEDGDVSLLVTLEGGGLKSHVVGTSGKSSAQVNLELRTQLLGNGFTVESIGDPTYVVSKWDDVILRVVYTHTDTGIVTSTVGARGPVPGTADVPTLTEWGILLLAMLMVAAALLVLRRRRALEAR